MDFSFLFHQEAVQLGYLTVGSVPRPIELNVDDVACRQRTVGIAPEGHGHRGLRVDDIQIGLDHDLSRLPRRRRDVLGAPSYPAGVALAFRIGGILLVENGALLDRGN